MEYYSIETSSAANLHAYLHVPLPYPSMPCSLKCLHLLSMSLKCCYCSYLHHFLWQFGPDATYFLCGKCALQELFELKPMPPSFRHLYHEKQVLSIYTSASYSFINLKHVVSQSLSPQGKQI